MSFEKDYLFGGETFFGQPELTDEQKLLRADLEKLQKDMAARKKNNYSEAENAEYFEDRMFQVQQDFYLRNQAVAEGLREELEKKRKEYLESRKRNAAEDMVTIIRLQMEYGALSDDQLREQAIEYIQKPGPEWTLDRLQVLNAELGKRGIRTISYAPSVETAQGVSSGRVTEKPFSEWIQETGGDQPWALQQNPELVKALRLYDSPYGTFTGLFDDGHLEPNLEIEKALEG